MRATNGVRPAIASVILLAATAACGSDSTTNPGGGSCRSTVTSASATSPTAGYVSIPGLYYTGETVVLGYTDAGGQPATRSGSVVTDGATIVLIPGLPSGNRSFSVRVDCTDAYGGSAHSTFASITVTVQ